MKGMVQMSTNTKDENIFKTRKINATDTAVSTADGDIFTFKITNDNYDLFVDYDNVIINSEQIKFACSKQKLDIQNDYTSVIILKNKNSFKVLLKDPKIDFADNQSSFQLKVKNDYLVVSITTPFKISVTKDNLLFSSNVSEAIELNHSFTAVQKAEISKLKDNKTLLISEEQNKTFLPYTVSELCAKFETNKYDSIEELIEKEFTVSNDYYKFPILARFKEGYKLVREKEHGTIKKAIDLGIDLMLNFNLNPSIITACKSLEELNIYLDCLEENELSKFLCFDIIYEISPTKI